MDRVSRHLAVNAGRGAYKAAKEAADIIASTKDMLLKMFRGQELSLAQAPAGIPLFACLFFSCIADILMHGIQSRYRSAGLLCIL